MLDVGSGMFMLYFGLNDSTDDSQPCQSLFVAPCSHVWHYKCIRPILNDHRTWPQFLCPNCRAVADLEADVDDPYDYEEHLDEEANDSADSSGTPNLNPNTEHALSNGTPNVTGLAQPAEITPVQHDAEPDSEANLPTRLTPVPLNANELPTTEADPSLSLLSRRNVSGTSMLQRGIKATRPTPDHTSPSPRRVPSNPSIPHENNTTQLTEPLNTLRVATPTPGDPPGPEGPMTPRNDAGPFVFDGSAGRAEGRRVVASLAEAAAEEEVGMRSTVT